MRAAGAIRTEPRLHAPGLVFDVRECGTTEVSQLHDPAGDRDHRTIRSVDLRVGVLGLVCDEQPARLISGRGRREVDTV